MYAQFIGKAVNSLAPERCSWNLTKVFFKFILRSNIFSASCEIGLWWAPQNPTDDESQLVQVMAWCHQAASHYLNQCWPISMSPYNTTRPQAHNELSHQAEYKPIFAVNFIFIFPSPTAFKLTKIHVLCTSISHTDMIFTLSMERESQTCYCLILILHQGFRESPAI